MPHGLSLVRVTMAVIAKLRRAAAINLELKGVPVYLLRAFAVVAIVKMVCGLVGFVRRVLTSLDRVLQRLDPRRGTD